MCEMKKRIKRAVPVLMLLFVMVFTVSCGGGDGGQAGADGTKAADSVIVTMPTTSEPEAGFDPSLGWGAGEHVHEPLIQSTLLVTDEEMNLTGDLATDYGVSNDGLIWTVTIRDDVKFTDGEPLTAGDVAFTYNLCRDSSSVADFSMLKEAVATGEYTVEFYMTRPYSPWPYTMAVTGIVPEHAYDKGYGENPIGSGRYIMKQWDRGQQVIFEANPDYYGGEVEIKKVTVLFAEEDAALAAAKAGQVDVAHTAPAYADSVTIDGYGIVSVESIDNRGINLPAAEPSEEDGVVYGNEFLSDVNVRRAINIGIDREKLIDETLGGHGSPAYSLCDKMPWYNDASEVSFDAEKAKELLEDAGWKAGGDGTREKDGVRAEFTLLFTPRDSVRQAIAENVASQLKDLGIEVTTESAGWDTAYDRAQSTPLVWGWGAHSPMELYNMYHTDENSDLGYARYSPYANDTVDGYMDMAMAATDTDEAAELWKKAQWDGKTGVTQDGDVPWVWLCNVDHLYYVRDGVDIGEQKIHPHGHGWSLLNNVDKWSIG